MSEVAAQFGVGRISAWRWQQRKKRTGSVAPKPMGGVRTVKLDEEALQTLRRLVLEKPDATRQELADALAEKNGPRVNPTAIGRGLAKLGFTRKKKKFVATERRAPEIEQKRQEFMARQSQFDPTQLVFLDESGSHVAMTRIYGWAPSGEQPIDQVPRNRGPVTTILGAFTLAGLVALMTITGGTTAAVFTTFVTQCLVPILQPGNIVVLDNLEALAKTSTAAQSARS